MHPASLLHKILSLLLLTPHYGALLHKMFYAILLSPLAAGRATTGQFPGVWVRKKANYKRLIAMVNFIDRVVPGIANNLSQALYTNNSFPWTPADIQLIAFGTGAAVFKLSLNGVDKVLRIYRKSVGKSYSGLLEIDRHYKTNYERMLTWYGGSLGLVPPMEFMVLQGSPLIGSVAASFQPYIDGEKQDLLDDFSDDQLVKLFMRHHCLREQFLYFVQQTIRQWDERKMCFDFLGKQNLMLVMQAGNYKLCLPDYGFFDFDKVKKKGPEIMARFEQRMNRLASLYKLTKEIELKQFTLEVAF